MRSLVMKFGGNALGTVNALSQLQGIITRETQRWDRVVVVVSALDGVTDMLLEAAQLAQVDNRRGYRRIAANLRSRHFALVDELPLQAPARATLGADIDQLLSQMLAACQAIAKDLRDELLASASDEVVAVGEQLSARIIAALLRQHGLRGAAVDSRSLIITDAVHGNANPDLAQTAQRVQERLLPMLQLDNVPVVTGYIGATSAGETTTLGRGGTDYTASVISALLPADALWIWTNVAGMMSADPRELPEARVIKRLSYDEAADLAYFGAKLLHARMIAPLAERKLPLRIKHIFAPETSGTLIAAAPESPKPQLKAVTNVLGLSLRRSQSGSLAGVNRLVGNTVFKTLGMRSEVMIASQSSGGSFLCLVIPTSIGIDGVDRLQRALKAKMSEYPEKMPWQIETVSLVTAIGSRLDNAPQLVGQVLEALAGIEILALSLGASHCSLSVVVRLADAPQAVRQIHALLLNSGSNSD
ncbi:MAG: aspartate kinase [Chloroflexi bacterium]|nr:aspartate kinase [Chloroflexota bacterium]MCY3582728.1 aspartate kinase [Chloroflexota bacterium]MCY3717485.1 aspartate kinase [Chloroflexota bacterium]MDE2652029.1 aspartate kinase [Chloroflexota bacterium]MXV94124.1 aspartate kinase [Chloroflexota bacterium]